MEGKHTVGVIGGSGLYDIEGLTNLEEVELETPFGSPSDAYITGELEGVKMVFLPRHGRGHRISPTEINSRANLWGMKKLGVSRIISVSAVGSMREEIAPGEFVLIDQFFDRTRHRPDTFFEGGVVAHVMFAEPIFLWLLIVPALLFVIWVWRLARRRSDIRRLARQRTIPVRERFATVGDLPFWLCLIVASAILIVALQDGGSIDGPAELFSTERVQQAEGLIGLPRDYGDVPQLFLYNLASLVIPIYH